MTGRLLAALACSLLLLAAPTASDATEASDGADREAAVQVDRALRHAQLEIGPRAVILGESAHASGRVGTYKHPVTLQRRTASGAWAKVAAKHTDAYGYFRFTVTPTRLGAASYRIRTTKWDVRGPVYSAVRTLEAQGPLEGPFFIVVGNNAVLQREAGGLQRSRPLYRIRDLGSVVAARGGSGRVLYSRWDGERETLGVRGGGLPDLDQIGTISGDECAGWTSISPDGRYVTFGAGTSDGIRCFPPEGITLVDTLMGTRRRLASPGDGSFASFHDPVFTGDGAYLLLSGFVDFYERTQVVDPATGALVSASGAVTHEGYRPTMLTTADGELVLRPAYDWVDEDCESRLMAVRPGSAHAASCWAEGVFTADESIHVLPSPDGTRLAWLSARTGKPRFMVSPVAEPTLATDLGGLGYTPEGNRQFLSWLSDDVLGVVDNDGTRKSITRDATTGADLGSWPRGVIGWMA